MSWEPGYHCNDNKQKPGKEWSAQLVFYPQKIISGWETCAGWPEGRISPPQGGIKHQSLHLLHLRATEKAREQGEHKEEEKEQACRDHGILINNSLKTI